MSQVDSDLIVGSLLEVIMSATIKGAEALGMGREIETVEVGKMADLVLVEANALENLKVLYGTGAIELTEDNETEDNEVVRVGGVKYTIEDGIVFDAKALLQDIAEMVEAVK